MSVTHEMVFVTPEMAREWLDLNVNNRNVRQHRVESLVRIILNGEWSPGVGSIGFGANGDLYDGQHRLMAIVKANKGVWVLVVRGLPPVALPAIDTFGSRSPGDAMKIAGHFTNSNDMAAVARIVKVWDDGGYRKSGGQRITGVPYSHQELLEWAQANTELAIWAVRLSRKVHKSLFQVPPQTHTAAAFFILARTCGSTGPVEEMAELMVNMRLLGPGDPLFTLCKYCSPDKATGKKKTLHPPGSLFVLFRTWNALTRGENLQSLKTGSTGDRDGGSHTIMVPTPVRGLVPVRT